MLAAMAHALSISAHAEKDLVTLAQAAAVAALLSCAPSQRETLARSFTHGHVLCNEHLPAPIRPATEDTQLFSMAAGNTPEDDALLARVVQSGALSIPCAVALVHVALRKRGGATQLAARLPFYLALTHAAARGEPVRWLTHHEDDAAGDAPRSVRTL